MYDIFNKKNSNMSSIALNHIFSNERVIAWNSITTSIPLDLSGLFTATLSSISNCYQFPCSDIPRPTEEREERIFNIIAGNQQRWRQTVIESEWFKKQDWIFQTIVTLFKHLPDSSELRNHQEFLRFRYDDLRDKFLFLSAFWDNGRSANSKISPMNPEKTAQILTTLAIEFDLKYKMIKNKEEICEEIRNAAKTGNLAHVVILGHGDPQLIEISRSDFIDSTFNFRDCFSSLNPAGTITLFSCDTGSSFRGNPLNNIAQSISNKAQRTVIAPITSIAPDFIKINSITSFSLYHPVKPEYCSHPIDPRVQNVFRTFLPQFRACPSVREINLHPIEKEGINVIKNELVSKSLMSPFVEFQDTQEFTRFCSNNPKKKILIVVSENDSKRSCHPQVMKEILGIISEKWDLKYKVIKSFKDICKEIKWISKNLSDVIIVANAGSSYSLISNIDKYPQNSLKEKLINCFANLEGRGKITLLGSSSKNSKEPYSFETIAKKIANLTGRIVVAPVPVSESIELSKIQISSTNPLTFFHQAGEKYDVLKQSNVFKLFHPQYKLCSPNLNPSDLDFRIQGGMHKILSYYDIASEAYNQELELSFDHLQFCKDNPKEKFLFLDTETNSHSLNHFLGRISEFFDVGYRKISFFNDICSEIEKTSKLGKLAHVLIAAPQTVQSTLYAGYHPWNSIISHSDNSIAAFTRGIRPDGWILSSERPFHESRKEGEKIGSLAAAYDAIFGLFSDFQNSFEPEIFIPEIEYPDFSSVQKTTLTPDQNGLAKCFEGLAKDGKVIILDAGQTYEGTYHYNQKIGQFFADQIKRNVIDIDIADNCKNDLDIRSIEPFRLYKTNNPNNCFKNPNFREFEPKKN